MKKVPSKKVLKRLEKLVLLINKEVEKIEREKNEKLY